MPRIGPVSVPADDHGEGPLWIDAEAALYWVDVYEAPSVQRFEPASGRFASWPMPAPITCLAPRKAGGLLAGMRGCFRFIGPNGTILLNVPQDWLLLISGFIASPLMFFRDPQTPQSTGAA